MVKACIVQLKAPGENFENLYAKIYEDGKISGYQSMEELDDFMLEKAIKMFIKKNMIGNISGKYGKDQECFKALGIVYTIAKEKLPDSGIYEIAQDTFQKLYKNMMTYEKMDFDHNDPESTDEKRRRYELDIKYINSKFNIIANNGADKILALL